MVFRGRGREGGLKDRKLKVNKPQSVRVTAKVAARLDSQPNEVIAKLKYFEKPYWDLERARIGSTRDVPVELVVNGSAVARKTIRADGTLGKVEFETPIRQSSWIALRIFPSSHTNPIFALVGGKPIRASRPSA